MSVGNAALPDRCDLKLRDPKLIVRRIDRSCGPLQIIASAIGLAVPKRPARHQSLPSQRLQVLKHQKVIGLTASQSRDRKGFALSSKEICEQRPNNFYWLRGSPYSQFPVAIISRGFVNHRALRTPRRARTVAGRKHPGRSLQNRSAAGARVRFATVLCRTGVADAANGAGDRSG